MSVSSTSRDIERLVDKVMDDIRVFPPDAKSLRVLVTEAIYKSAEFALTSANDEVRDAKPDQKIDRLTQFSRDLVRAGQHAVNAARSRAK